MAKKGLPKATLKRMLKEKVGNKRISKAAIDALSRQIENDIACYGNSANKLSNLRKAKTISRGDIEVGGPLCSKNK